MIVKRLSAFNPETDFCQETVAVKPGLVAAGVAQCSPAASRSCASLLNFCRT